MLPLIVSFAALPVSGAEFRARALHWAAGFACCAYYESNGLEYPGGPFERLLAVAPQAGPAPTTLADLRGWLAQAPSAAPRCGFLTYDLKNEIEALHSGHFDGLQWPALHFFSPETWLVWQPDSVEIHGETPGVLEAILATPVPAEAALPAIQLMPRLPKREYLAAVEAIREDILNGEVYELNLCQEFYAENVALDPVGTFLRLNAASPTPFAGFYKWQDRYLLCASPERFLQKKGPLLTSQPIKGTIRRGATPAEDERQRHTLLHDEKERAENLMIVDLVRNDLARVARTGTVQVPELFGLYPFRHVWQMISTIQARLRPEVDLTEILRATFPMGSMTGAPKIRAMQLIEHYERTKRGLYSGSLGYITPTGDFDFNVVIRSLQYRAGTGYLSFQVGSAITYDSNPAREYDECLLKARALLDVLGVERL
ncbi:para-aminobenzoate synthetase component 1 [Hymenobacter daecheongensis DSM 21074]|uniref:Para-aminobenzoate synthetase component 1 n=1 Tax=Hymenobacter daecheongensis DSM 21074 TaxID=1121955 RepID=A0A1M6HQ65_9BACT|nr:anthranilate synthase component I family protein [Hymenobacter daecheongensis]SHJ24263.1 para-aminobenzoate synthetase component 1 [Hymenobacter daecheongensis DSM 21074]